MMNTGKLKGMTVFITGATRGIGKAIALKVAKDGANVVITGKTVEKHPKLPGTIYDAAKDVEEAGGKALPCALDIRNEDQVNKAVEEAVAKFGGIDILVNNASAISLTSTLTTEMKRFDLMHSINARGTFLVSKACLPYLKKGKNPHILNLSPPLNLNSVCFENHLAYTMSKYGMSFCVLGMQKEFKGEGIAVNALWPRTAIATAAVEMLGGEDAMKSSRKPEIVADAAYAILIKDSKTVTGNFFIDDDVLLREGITDLKPYAVSPDNSENLMADLFLDGLEGPGRKPEKAEKVEKAEPVSGAVDYDQKIDGLFETIKQKLSTELVQKTQSVYQFNVKGTVAQNWYIDLKSGSGSAGKGKPPTPPDVTLTMEAKHFFDLFSGKLSAPAAFMSGKLQIAGKMQDALKLEKLMKSLKSKL